MRRDPFEPEDDDFDYDDDFDDDDVDGDDDFEDDEIEEGDALTVCPNCHKVWGMEEIDFQQCDACGYPDPDDFDDDLDGDDEDPADLDEEDE